jgi:hypothetical protein
MREQLMADIAGLEPGEILLSEQLAAESQIATMLRQFGTSLTVLSRQPFRERRRRKAPQGAFRGSQHSMVLAPSREAKLLHSVVFLTTSS